jgi:hypothetical protein
MNSTVASAFPTVRAQVARKRIETDRARAHLGAVGGEVVNGFRVFAHRRRLPVDAIEATVTGQLANGLAYLEVVGEDRPPTIARIHIKVFVATTETAAAQTLFAQMLNRLPLVCTLRETTDLAIDLVLTS